MVYDRASGGAGYASTIADEPIRCLKAARDLLDCSAPGGCRDPEAEQFCSRCLLSSDTQHMIERCNRRAAFHLLNDLIPRLEIGAEDSLFGANTEVESTPLADTLARRIAQAPSATLVLWLHGEPQYWELDEWPARSLAETWGPRGIPIRIVVRSDVLRSVDISIRQSLARLIQRCQRAELVEWCDGTSAGIPLAALLHGGVALEWASRDLAAGKARAGWGRSPTAPIVRGLVDAPLFGRAIYVSTFLSSAPEAVVVEIASDADGMATGFGLRLRRILEAHSGDLLRGATHGLKELIYSDRYVFSPLSALLVAELIGAFAGRTDVKVLIRMRGASKSVHTTPPWQVQHDWTAQSDRMKVLQTLLARISNTARVTLDDATPHRRTLVLRTEAGSLELTLDQRIGPWQPAQRYSFDFGKPPEQQSRDLLKMPIRVRNGSATTFAVIRRL